MGKESLRLAGEQNEDILRDIFRGRGISGDPQGGSINESGVPLEELTEGLVCATQVAGQEDLIVKLRHRSS